MKNTLLFNITFKKAKYYFQYKKYKTTTKEVE